MNPDKNKMTEALVRLFEDGQVVEMTISKQELWCVISAIQLACRHPKFTGPTREIVEDIARKVGATLTGHDPDLRMLLEMGWRQEFDEVGK